MTTNQELIDWCEAEYKRTGQDRLKYVANHLRELDKPDCTWTYDNEQFMYDTGCGNAWCFDEGLTLTENAIKYCPFCGGGIIDSAIQGEPT
jgi:hypothetical protein